ncbi:MAG: DNA polymerase III subunit beta [Tannerella sp.]|jgi:DNA polymerase-3 subunit beta|nr:DNA polymerase III subunit beta [Tannerella sp.]
MKFVVSSSALLARLQSISKVLASKNTLPILDSFLFQLEENKLTITASDVETRLVTSVDVESTEGTGLFAISAKMLLEPLKKLPEQPLTFSINDENIEVFIYFANGKYNFIGQKGDTYPKQKPLSETAVTFSTESQILLSGVSRTLFATAEDELRPVMNGIYFDILSDKVTFVASDGHKLVRQSNNTVQIEGRASFILPKKPANLLKSLLGRNSDPVKIQFDENNAYITTEHFEMVCRLIEGRYPNYNSVIPQDNPNKIMMERVVFLNALERVSVFSNPASSLVKLQLSNNEIIISAQDIDFSTSAEEKISCQYEGPDFSIGFKATFLIEMLSNINTSEIILALADPSRAGVIVPEQNEENEELLMLLMPMVLSD